MSWDFIQGKNLQKMGTKMGTNPPISLNEIFEIDELLDDSPESPAIEQGIKRIGMNVLR
ncbi:MAG: hypothetical protein ACO3JG_15195 [Luteolibacter sp.]